MPKEKSSRAKGNYYELRSKELLEKAGYQVERALAKIIWIAPSRPISQHHDFFGAFDLWAVSKDGHRLVQVKYLGLENDGRRKEWREMLQSFPSPPNTTKELHIWKQTGKQAVLEIDVVT